MKKILTFMIACTISMIVQAQGQVAVNSLKNGLQDFGNKPEVLVSADIQYNGCLPPVGLEVTVDPFNNILLTWNAPNDSKKNTNEQEIVFQETFETAIVPYTWKNIDADGDGRVWGTTYEHWSGLTMNMTGHSGYFAVGSESTSAIGDPYTPDNWLITPRINIGKEGVLEYYIGAQDQAYAKEHYGVYISTTGFDIEDFILLFEETLDFGKESMGTTDGQRAQSKEGSIYVQRTIDLSDYLGNIYIAFRHFNTSGTEWILLLDDVVVKQTSIADPPEGLESYQIFKNNDVTPYATVPATTLSYIDKNVSPTGNYCYKIVAHYDDNCSSMPTNEVCVDIITEMKTITGTVKDAESNDPIDNVTVRFDNNNITTTAEDGTFSINLIKDAVYNVIFSSDPYDNYTESWFKIDTNKTLDVSMTRKVCDPAQSLTADLDDEGMVSLEWYVPGKSTNKGAWDKVLDFLTYGGGELGVATDGNHIYTTVWYLPGTFSKYEMDGTFIERFSIEGLGQDRELTYDGTYFYITSESNEIHQLDLENKTIISSFTCPISLRCCAYDPSLDEFWVGHFEQLIRINRKGEITDIATIPPSRLFGIAYDDVTAGGPYLLLFSDTGESACEVHQYNIANDVINPTPLAEITDLPDYEPSSLAGGISTGYYDDKFCAFTLVQNFMTSAVGIYDLGDPSSILLGFDIYRQGIKIDTVGPDVIEYIDDLNGFPSGEYEYCIVAVYDNGCQALGVCDEVYYSSCAAPIDLAYTLENNGVNLTWNIPENENPNGYNVFRDNQLIASNITDLSYLDTGINTGGTYLYGVTAIYPNCESEATEIQVIYTAIDDYFAQNVRVSPNPASDKITIEGDNIFKVEIFNSLGQHILTKYNSETIDVTHFNNGIYFYLIEIDGYKLYGKVIVNH
ncbi:MAG: choice-of-anchor J domain-containing protein [Bacteroidales bacterium]|nr:choice-of-anchor J domain-containing protein [Acholeplasmataceae bacterium]MCK9448346.1 choice-of-anchor J domain-containing protein [Bacteroidales bacterium]